MAPQVSFFRYRACCLGQAGCHVGCRNFAPLGGETDQPETEPEWRYKSLRSAHRAGQSRTKKGEAVIRPCVVAGAPCVTINPRVAEPPDWLDGRRTDERFERPSRRPTNAQYPSRATGRLACVRSAARPGCGRSWPDHQAAEYADSSNNTHSRSGDTDFC